MIVLCAGLISIGFKAYLCKHLCLDSLESDNNCYGGLEKLSTV